MKNYKIEPEMIRFRDYEPSDIDRICDYWFRSPKGFLGSIGIDQEKMFSESDIRNSMTKSFNSRIPDIELKSEGLVIEYKGEPIGTHIINEIEFGLKGIFHAHIWKPEFRQIGIGTYTYPRACKIFFDRFQLQKIVFKTPVDNLGANLLKKKLGMKPIEKIKLCEGPVKDGTVANVYVLFSEEIDSILKSVSIR